MKNLFPFLCVVLFLTTRCKEPTGGGDNGSIVQESPAAADGNHQKDTIVLLDTLIPPIGKVRVFYDPISDRLCLMSSLEKDTILGFTDWAFWGDSIIPQPTSVEDIGLVRQERLTWHNIVYARNKTLFFAVNDQLRRSNVYAAKITDGKWLFLCEKQGSCSVLYNSWGCKILDERRDRLLVKWPGISTIPEEDYKDIAKIGVFEYSAKGKMRIGELKLEDWERDQCDSMAILEWYKAYEKIANKRSFNQYLAIPRVENDDRED